MVEFALPLIKRVVKEALFEWIQHSKQRPIDKILRDISTRERLGPRERDISSTIVYDLVRFWPLYLPQDFNPEESRHLHAFEAVLNQKISGTKDSTKAHESAKPKFDDNPTSHLRKLHHVPEFLMAEIQVLDSGTQAWHSYLHESINRAPVFFRLKRSLPVEVEEQAHQKLIAAGAQQSPWNAHSYLFPEALNINRLKDFQGTLGEIQDEHSQLAALILKPTGEQKILDLCAGAGGKTLHLSDLMNNKGQIFAHDSDLKRLATLTMRAKKAGATNIQVLKDFPRGQKFDSILIDAPCSGLGTLRRSPDRLYAFQAKEAERLRSLQTNLLLNAKNLLAPNGKILYVTCTPRPSENLGVLLPLLKQEKLKALDLHQYLLESRLTNKERFLTRAYESSASQITRAYCPDLTPILKRSILTVGPLTMKTGHDQASDTLKGDSFFFALVQ